MDSVRIVEQLGFALRSRTRPAWAPLAVDHLDDFLRDHAAAERKVHGSCLMMVARYQDRAVLVESMLELAREELQHFTEMVAILHGRGLRLANDVKDPYIQALQEFVRPESEGRLMDRLLLCSAIEARGCERFGLIGEELARRKDPLAAYYKDLSLTEARHYGAYLRVAKTYFPAEVVDERMAEWMELEGRVQLSLPVRPCLH